MSDWYLWDGETQRGPLAVEEIENRIRYHPNPDVVRVWRDGFADWKTPQEAFNLSASVPAVPPPLPPLEPTQEKSRHQNFVVRHWRGEFPLWLSYWVVGILSNVFAVLAVGAISAITISRKSFGPTGILVYFVSTWSLLVLISIWQLTGIWRSAQRSKQQRNSIGKMAPWAIMAKIMVCLGFLQVVALLIRTAIPQVSEAVSIALMNDPEIPPYSIRVMNGTEAEIIGGIKFGLTSDFEKILKASPGVHVVHLDSIGGRIGEGEKLSALIRAKGLDTYVDGRCASACTIAFVAGHQRILKQGATLGFHRGSFAGKDDSSEMEKAYLAAGVSREFVGKAMATKSADLWEPTETELVAAGVVTRISNGDEYAISGLGESKSSRDDWDKGLQKIALYKAIKDKYPSSYDEILDTFYVASTKGTPRGQLLAEGRAKVNGLIKKLLPHADDAVLIEFGKLLVDQYTAIQSQNATTCYRFASGLSDEDAIRAIPKPLRDRELEIDALVVSSAQNQNVAAKTDASWSKILGKLKQKGYSAEDLKFLSGTSVKPADHGRYCELTIELYQEIISLPMKEAASVLRDIFS
jgi:hypothetical protein